MSSSCLPQRAEAADGTVGRSFYQAGRCRHGALSITPRSPAHPDGGPPPSAL